MPLGKGEGVCVSQAAPYFSRLRREVAASHHRIASPYIGSTRDASWREDNRRVDNGMQNAMMVEAADRARRTQELARNSPLGNM